MSELDDNSTQSETLDSLENGVRELYLFRDHYHEQDPQLSLADRCKLVKERRQILIDRFTNFDDTTLSGEDRPRYLYLQGRTYNSINEYDARAVHSLSKAVKLAPRMVEAWNELGECYWKNGNTKEAKSSFEGALKTDRNKVTLRSLSIILRQEMTLKTTSEPAERKKVIEHSVDLAKEAVGQDFKDGQSWCVLGNAYLCLYFSIAQDPAILKLAMSAYRQAECDAVARGQSDLYYNKGVAHKYCEQYPQALDCFRRASELEPAWATPAEEGGKLTSYLARLADLLASKGKLKVKRLERMAQSIDEKTLGDYGNPEYLKANNITLTPCNIEDLSDGVNKDKVLPGRVIGSIYSESEVPFTFVLMDRQQRCAAVTAYNWAGGQGVLVGDAVAVPAPRLAAHHGGAPKYSFTSIRVDNPRDLMVNGRRVNLRCVAPTRIKCQS